MNAQELRPMGIGDILDVTFRLYRQKFLTFLLIALVVYVPYALLMSFFAMMQTSAIQASAATYSSEVEASQLAQAGVAPAVIVMSVVGGFIFLILVLPLCTAALVKNISASYLGENRSAGQSYSRAAPRLPSLILANILSIVIVFIGICMLFVPGIIFSLWFMLIAPVVVLEGVGGVSALGRSRELMRGNLGKGFLLMLVVGILAWIISFALGLLLGLIPIPFMPLSIFIQNIVPALVLPIQTAPFILLYYDLRIRKEAFDLQKLSESLAQPEAT